MKHYHQQFIKLFTKLLFTAIVIATFGCNKLVDNGFPKNALPTDAVFQSQTTANAAVVALYGGMYTGYTTSIPGYGEGVDVFPGMLSDEFTYNGAIYDQYVNNSLLSNEAFVSSFWADNYAYIYRANAVIEAMATSTFPDAVKNQFQGEALFVRAFCYFHLVNLYGDVPLVTTTVVKDNQLKARTAAGTIYNQIITDLTTAAAILSVTYPIGTTANTRVRANKYAATALLARVYLYHNDYANAEAKATEVINATSLYTLQADVNNVFLANNSETIWSFDTTQQGYAYVASNLVPNTGAQASFIITNSLFNAFEVNDKRKTAWIGSSGGTNFSNKYRARAANSTPKENDVALRLAEQYLIRAEARAQQNNLTGAAADLNVIRNRAGLPNTAAATQTTLLDATLQENRIEFLAEWGHRWFDLKRTGKVNTVIGALKPTFWQSTDALLPIPNSEIINNPNLTQNQGY